MEERVLSVRYQPREVNPGDLHEDLHKRHNSFPAYCIIASFSDNGVSAAAIYPLSVDAIIGGVKHFASINGAPTALDTAYQTMDSWHPDHIRRIVYEKQLS